MAQRRIRAIAGDPRNHDALISDACIVDARAIVSLPEDMDAASWSLSPSALTLALTVRMSLRMSQLGRFGSIFFFVCSGVGERWQGGFWFYWKQRRGGGYLRRRRGEKQGPGGCLRGGASISSFSSRNSHQAISQDSKSTPNPSVWRFSVRFWVWEVDVLLTHSDRKMEWPASGSKVMAGVPPQSDLKWRKSDSMMYFRVISESLWFGVSLPVSLLSHLSSFDVSV